MSAYAFFSQTYFYCIQYPQSHPLPVILSARTRGFARDLSGPGIERSAQSRVMLDRLSIQTLARATAQPPADRAA